MRLRFPNLPDLGRVVVVLKNVRWRDPLVQVWGVIGVVLVAGMIAYYVRRTGAGEQKNSSWPAGLLTRSAANGSWHPEICFGEPAPVQAEITAGSADLDLRECADKAAARKNWHFLTTDLRRSFTESKTAVQKVLVTWSGTRGGDAKALDLYFDSVRDDARSGPGDFVIGNGRRSRDGTIEITHRWTALTAESRAGELRICLVGDSTALTSAQKDALGELISFIETRSGTVTLCVHEPQTPGILAHAP